MKNIKIFIIDSIIKEIEGQIRNTKNGRLSAVKESKAHKGAMASRYDTFKEEAQYLADGYSIQLARLNKTLNELRYIRRDSSIINKGSIRAIVEVQNLSDNSRAKYFLLPIGGGNIYEVKKEIITVLSVGAPLARAFIGAVAGDEIEVKIQDKTKIFNVISIT